MDLGRSRPAGPAAAAPAPRIGRGAAIHPGRASREPGRMSRTSF